MSFEVVSMREKHISGVVALQRDCFPEPFPEELLWNGDHLTRHLEVFPEGQFVVLDGGVVIASASSTKISEENWKAHSGWEATVGGPFLNTFDPTGSTLYGLDISVHPGCRRRGVGKFLYETRFKLVKDRGLTRFGTACRLPDFRAFENEHPGVTVDEYAENVVQGFVKDRTLSPLLRYGLTFLGVIHRYMEDYESHDAAALVEWQT